MSELKEFDDGIFDEDEYETPKKLYEELCTKYNIQPSLDVAANQENKKCYEWFGPDLRKDSLKINWNYNRDVWCNPPHSKTEQFVRKAHKEWQEGNINIIMIIPTNTMSSRFWHECIEGIAEYHAVEGRPRFLKNGRPSIFNSRNAYVCVLWRKNP